MTRSASVVAALAVAIVALAACNKQSNERIVKSETVTISETAPPRGGDWSDVVNATSAGFMMGNPNAKVKLVEIGALTCPHCREFDEKGVPSLINDYVKSGQISWEFRTYLLQAPDIPAALLARCNGAKSFFSMARALYADQPQWMGKLIATPQAQLEQVQNLPEKQEFVQMARLAGLQDWAATHGLPPAKSNQCLSDTSKIDKLVQLSSDVNAQYPDFVGTPSFIINGTLLKDTASWDQLEPQLQAALK